jgi:methyl-accepting chemotaxis protein
MKTQRGNRGTEEIGVAEWETPIEKKGEHAEEAERKGMHQFLSQPQMRLLLRAMKAARDGNFTVRLPAEDGLGEIAEVFNDFIGMNQNFAGEIIRVSRIVGEEGRLTERASLIGVAGSWKTSVESINVLINAMAQPTTEVGRVITAVAEGDLSKKMVLEIEGRPLKGEFARIGAIVNTMVGQLGSFASEVTRVAKEVGTEGKLGGQAEVKGVGGTWKDLTDNVNAMASNLTNQVRNIASVTTAVAQGDLSKKITVEARGEILQLKDTINTMVDQLNGFASEVTRVAREVGTEGKLGGQAEVKGVAGTWKELTDNVNAMASSLTSQVRDIAKVTIAVANGDLSQKIVVEAMGEILELKNTINGMVDNLNMIIGEINDVMSMVGEGNLTKLIGVEASGEFASMVEGINGTIDSLRGIVTELREAGVNIGSVSQNMLNAGQEMNTMVTQLSGSVEQIADGAKTQAQQIGASLKESEGVGKTASSTLTQSEGMNQAAEIANKAVVEGTKAMEDTVKNTDLMLKGSQESVSRIESLSKSSEQIQEIVEVIRDIATQTNILAINAAIEAVRAGKLGKGFAVVAEEVKTLSADSKAQAKKISTLVQSVLKETEETSTTIKTMAANVETGRRSIEQTSRSFTDIKRSIETTSTTARGISVAAADQKKSIDSISESLDKISGIAADTSTGSTQSAESAKHLLGKTQELTTTATTLAGMSEKLQQTVGRFSVGEGAPAKTGRPAVKKAARPGVVRPMQRSA